jgi:hypothetical protein
LHKLAELGLVVKTPSSDYDDSYCIEYAKRKNAYIVTNDKFRDFIDKQDNNAAKNRERKWVKDYSISYAFHEDHFLPNPDSKIFNLFPLDEFKLH